MKCILCLFVLLAMNLTNGASVVLTPVNRVTATQDGTAYASAMLRLRNGELINLDTFAIGTIRQFSGYRILIRDPYHIQYLYESSSNVSKDLSFTKGKDSFYFPPGESWCLSVGNRMSIQTLGRTSLSVSPFIGLGYSKRDTISATGHAAFKIKNFTGTIIVQSPHSQIICFRKDHEHDNKYFSVNDFKDSMYADVKTYQGDLTVKSMGQQFSFNAEEDRFHTIRIRGNQARLGKNKERNLPAIHNHIFEFGWRKLPAILEDIKTYYGLSGYKIIGCIPTLKTNGQCDPDEPVELFMSLLQGHGNECILRNDSLIIMCKDSTYL